MGKMTNDTIPTFAWNINNEKEEMLISRKRDNLSK